MGTLLVFISSTAKADLIKNTTAVGFFILLMSFAVIILGWIFVGVIGREAKNATIESAGDLKEETHGTVD